MTAPEEDPYPDDEGFDEEGEYEYCDRCNNEGFVLICVDDLCHGSGNEPGERCIHGDGDIVCPKCHGRGVL